MPWRWRGVWGLRRCIGACRQCSPSSSKSCTATPGASSNLAVRASSRCLGHRWPRRITPSGQSWQRSRCTRRWARPLPTSARRQRSPWPCVWPCTRAGWWWTASGETRSGLHGRRRDDADGSAVAAARGARYDAAQCGDAAPGTRARAGRAAGGGPGRRSAGAGARVQCPWGSSTSVRGSLAMARGRAVPLWDGRGSWRSCTSDSTRRWRDRGRSSLSWGSPAWASRGCWRNTAAV